MRKTLVVATREYLAAVRTRTFLIGLLIMPLMMGGSIVLQHLLKDVVNTADQHYALVDRTPDRRFVATIEKAVAAYNAKTEENGQRMRPYFMIEPVPPSAPTSQDIERQRYELSERVRQGKLIGFLEVLDAASAGNGKKTPGKDELAGQIRLRYQSNRVTDKTFASLAEKAVAKQVRARA